MNDLHRDVGRLPYLGVRQRIMEVMEAEQRVGYKETYTADAAA